eukprot:4510785-Amphidinium_carterae.1
MYFCAPATLVPKLVAQHLAATWGWLAVCHGVAWLRLDAALTSPKTTLWGNRRHKRKIDGKVIRGHRVILLVADWIRMCAEFIQLATACLKRQWLSHRAQLLPLLAAI